MPGVAAAMSGGLSRSEKNEGLQRAVAGPVSLECHLLFAPENKNTVRHRVHEMLLFYNDGL